MSRYFNWPTSLKRLVRFAAARAEDVNDALDDLSAGMDTLDADVDRAIKLPVGAGNQVLNLAPGVRANKVLAFDASGNVSVSVNDVDSSAASASAAQSSANAAAASATAASTSATNAASSASSASTSATNASKLNLGAKASAPTLDNQGQALQAGASYFDTTMAKWRVWSGSIWVNGYPGAVVQSVNGQTGNVALGKFDLTPIAAATFSYTNNLVTGMSEDGVTTTIVYNAQNQVSTVTYQRGANTLVETYTYSNGKVVSMSSTGSLGTGAGGGGGGGESGGPAAWGAITGTLGDQADLASALSDKANTATLAPVATSGAYADLTGTPMLGTAAESNVGDFATAAQGVKADSAVQPAGLAPYAKTADLPPVPTALSQMTNDVGFVTASTPVIASEPLTAGDWVSLWDSGGGARVRKSDHASLDKEVDGYVLVGVASGAVAEVFTSGMNTAVDGQQLGSVFAAAAGAGSASVGAGAAFAQRIGTAVRPDAVVFSRGPAVGL